MKKAEFVGGCRGDVGVGCAGQGKVNWTAGLEAQMRWTGPAASGPLSTASVGTRPRRSSWHCRSTVALAKWSPQKADAELTSSHLPSRVLTGAGPGSINPFSHG